MIVGLSVAAVAGAVAVVLLLVGRDDDGSAERSGPRGPAPTVDTSGLRLNTGFPPWELPADPAPYIEAAQLVALPREVLDVHYHAHLDVIVDGERLIVPSGIGYVVADGTVRAVTALHTHDINGLIHIESGVDAPFTLGQLFTEWGVRLDRLCMGGLCTSDTKAFKVYVDGKEHSGDPSTIVFRPHQEVAMWFGDADETPKVPDSYEFGPGE